MKKITVVGSGYVGMANGVALSQKNQVAILDIDPERVRLINKQVSPIEDKLISEWLKSESLYLFATLDKDMAYSGADYVIVATPTDYDPIQNYFNTGSVESVIRDALEYSEATIVIKSTIPVGFVNRMREKFDTDRIIFSPEFLREGQALDDCINPTRIVVGDKTPAASTFAQLLQDASQSNDIPIVLTEPSEAEAVKLFANSYLAMRVAFFNELDTYAEYHKLDASNIIDGMCYDERIGLGYNNPSFGYGGYCFPKDTKQLLANYKEHRIPNRLIGSIVYSNEIRKDWISNQILHRNPKVVGIYRMAMKAGSDNYRSSAIQGIIERLSTQVKVIIYEPMCAETDFLNCVVETDLNKFKKISDVIVTNRLDDNIIDMKDKIYTRDIYGDN